MSRAIVLIIGCSLATLACSNQSSSGRATPTASSAAQDFNKEFEGTIDNRIEIVMKLQRSGNSLSGTYLYKKVGTEIPLKGTTDNQQTFTLNEFDKNGNRTGIFKGQLKSLSQIEGTWSKPNGDKQMSFLVREKHGASVAAQAPAPSPTPTPTPPSLDEQAVNEIHKKYETVYTKCGDSYYTKIGPDYYQFKEVTFRAAPRAPAPADNLNGIEWAGNVLVISKFTRKSYVAGGPLHWGQYGSQSEPQHFSAQRVKGKWEVTDAFASMKRTYDKPTCAELPKD